MEQCVLFFPCESGWLIKFNKGPTTSIRWFFLNNRTKIEEELEQGYPKEYRKIRDKLFSTVEDFIERHDEVHYGRLLTVGEIVNYDAILTKVRDVLKILIDNKILG
jgi:hypothetical protein